MRIAVKSCLSLDKRRLSGYHTIRCDNSGFSGDPLARGGPATTTGRIREKDDNENTVKASVPFGNGSAHPRYS